MKKRILFAVIIFFILLFITGILRFQNSKDGAEETVQEAQVLYEDIPRKGTVTMLDLGADSCIPCKMMAPIMEKMEKEYKDRADIIFIDVWKHPEQAKRFNIRAIPTQIFFDKEGREADRHVGFLAEAAIVGKLKGLGVK